MKRALNNVLPKRVIISEFHTTNKLKKNERMKKLVVLSGAGISAESGIKTFRDSDGLWENHKIEDVCTYDAWLKNPLLVLDFYNNRRRQLSEVEFNLGHKTLVEFENYFDVTIITQNVDNLHERAGSKKVVHLHGELTKARSTKDDSLIYENGIKDINIGDLCEKGSQLRPHIVWFGEAVPMIEKAAEIVSKADILIVVGTSLVVYPAAGLLHYFKKANPIWYIDPNPSRNIYSSKNITIIAEKASIGLQQLLLSIK